MLAQIAVAVVETDPVSNGKLSNSADDCRGIRARVDAACAAILAVTEGERRHTERTMRPEDRKILFTSEGRRMKLCSAGGS